MVQVLLARDNTQPNLKGKDDQTALLWTAKSGATTASKPFLRRTKRIDVNTPGRGSAISSSHETGNDRAQEEPVRLKCPWDIPKS